MKKSNDVLYLKTAMTLIFLAVLLSCNTQVKKEESKTNTSNNAVKSEDIKIPDAVIQFLIDSAAQDFNDHQPPTAIDIRNVKAGYFISGNKTTYMICGEFLSQEDNDWIPFVTIKTSGYEQYIGDNVYCQKATFEKSANDLSDEIKRKLNSLNK